MKRKWRRVNPPGWLGQVGSKLGLHLEKQDTEYIKSMTFSTVVSASEPLLTGMVIGHWLVGMTALQGSFKPKRVHICISHCGVLAGYEPWEIAAGRLPKTCYGCRPGEHAPPVTRVVVEDRLEELQQHWQERYIMATAFEEKSQLDTKDGHELWAMQGRPVMQEIVGRTRFGMAFGWKVYVRRFMDLRHSRPKHHRVKINAIYKGERRFELFVQHKAGGTGFIVDLSTGRSDVTFGDITNEIERAVKILQSLDVEGNFEDEKAATAESNGHAVVTAGPIDVAKLMKIKTGIENLMTVGKDVNELAELKEKARKKVEAATAKKGDLHVKLVEAEERQKTAIVKYKTACEMVDNCERSLRNALAARENTLVDRDRANDAVAAAANAYKPVEDEAAAAEKELKELEELETERLKSVGDAKGMAALLEALARIGG